MPNEPNLVRDSVISASLKSWLWVLAGLLALLVVGISGWALNHIGCVVVPDVNNQSVMTLFLLLGMGILGSMALGALALAWGLRSQRTGGVRHSGIGSIRLQQDDFNALIAASPAVIYRVDLRPNAVNSFDYFSSNIHEIFGHNPIGLGDIQDWWRRHIHPDDRATAELEGDFRHWDVQGKSSRYRLLYGNGHYGWVADTARLVRDDVGQPLFLIGALLDIDVQMHLQVRLEEEQSRYRLIAENIQDVIGLHAPDCTLRWVGGSTRSILGYKPEQLLTRDLWTLIHPDDRVQFIKRPWQMFAMDDTPQTWIYRMRTAWGVWRWIETRATAIHDEHAQLMGIQTVSRDIDKQVAIERKLAESEQMYRSIFDHVDAVVFIVGVEPDGDFMFLASNDAHARLTGYTRERFARHRPHEILPRDLADWVVGNYRDCVARREPIRYAQRVDVPAGNPFLNIVLTPIFDEDGAVSMIIGLGIDQTEQQQLILELQQIARRLQHVKDIAQLGSFELDVPTGQYLPSVLLTRWFGEAIPHVRESNQALKVLPESGSGSLSTTLFALLPPPLLALAGILCHVSAIDQQRLVLMLQRLWAQTSPRMQTDVLMCRLDGVERTIIWEVQLVLSETGAPLRLEGTLQDVTDRVAAEQAMQRTNRRDAAVLHTAGEGIFGVDAQGKMSFANPAARRLLGFDTQHLTGLDVADIVYGEYPPESGFLAALDDGEPRSGLQENFWRRADGLFPVRLSVAVLPDDFDSARNGLVVVFSDISEMKHHEQLLETMAITDELTGLPNRRHFMQRLDEEFDRATRYQSPTSVLMLDIDHFKRINDQYGHAGGDEMLRQFSLIIQAMLRRQDLCGRLGGEEFAILLPNTVCLDAYEIAQRLRIAIAAIRVEWGDEVIQCTASMGVSDLMAEAGSASEGLSRADNALYLAKARGRNQVCGCMETENNPA